MAVDSSDILLIKAALTSDVTGAQNGGRPGLLVDVGDNYKNKVFPDTRASERAAGCMHWRKLFWVNSKSDGTAAVNLLFFLRTASPGVSHGLLYPGTLTDTQDVMIGRGDRPYGVGTLTAAAALGATQITVQYEDASHAALAPFRAGDAVVIAFDPGDPLFDWEQATVGAGGVRDNGDGTVTLTLAAGLTKAWAGHSASGTAWPVYVASAWPAGTLQATASAPTVNGAGSYSASGNLIPSPAGGLLQGWTLTFINNADGSFTGAFRLDGDSLGSGIATGSRGADFSPPNPAGGVYFTLKAVGWAGTWAPGDRLSFTTTPGAAGFWLKRTVPAGAPASQYDDLWPGFVGDSA